MAEPDRIETLAGQVADGAEVDWARLREETTASDDPRLLDAMELIAGVQRFVGLLEDTQTLSSELGADVRASGSAGSAGALGSWGPFELIESLGKGAFGEVFRAYYPRLRRTEAIKLLGRGDTPGWLDEDRAIREARNLARVQHRNVVQVFDAERHQGRAGIRMELIRGQTLREILRRDGPLPVGKVFQIGIDLCSALEEVHASGLVHRDVKTSNVMIEAGETERVVLMDLGIAVRHFEASPDPENLAGTPKYLAPEVFLRQAPASSRSDIFSLGVVLFDLLTDSFPYDVSSIATIEAAHRSTAYKTLLEVAPGSHRGLCDAIQRAIDVDPSKRWPTARHMRQDLARSFVGLPGCGAPEGRGQGQSQGREPSEAAVSISDAASGERGTSLTRRAFLTRTAVALTVLGGAGASVVRLFGYLEPEARARRLFEEAKSLHEDLEFEDAIQKAREAIGLDPELAIAYQQLAKSLIGTGHLAESFGESRRGYELRLGDRVPPFESALVEAEWFTNLRDHDRVIGSFKRVLGDLGPTDSARAWRRIATIDWYRGDLAPALDGAQRAYDADPDLFNLGFLVLLLAENRRSESALELFEGWRESTPEGAERWHSYPFWGAGVAHMIEGRFGAARSAFETLLKKANTRDFGTVHLTQLSTLEGDLDAARARISDGGDHDRVRGRNYHEVRRACLLAWIMIAVGEPQRVRAILEPLFDLPPLPIFLWQFRDLADVAFHAHWSEGVAFARQRVEAVHRQPEFRTPESARMLDLTSGLELWLEGRVSEAEERFSAALLRQRDSFALWALALLRFRELGQLPQAHRDFADLIDQKQLEIFNRDFIGKWLAAHELAADCAQQLGRLDEAEELRLRRRRRFTSRVSSATADWVEEFVGFLK